MPCVRRNAGETLLLRLGWKPGHGLGPRRLRPARGDEDADGRAGELYLLPPADVAVLDMAPKANMFGLGFDALQHAPEFQGLYHCGRAGPAHSARMPLAAHRVSSALAPRHPVMAQKITAARGCARCASFTDRRAGDRKSAMLNQDLDDEDADLTIDSGPGLHRHLYLDAMPPATGARAATVPAPAKHVFAPAKPAIVGSSALPADVLVSMSASCASQNRSVADATKQRPPARSLCGAPHSPDVATTAGRRCGGLFWPTSAWMRPSNGTVVARDGRHAQREDAAVVLMPMCGRRRARAGHDGLRRFPPPTIPSTYDPKHRRTSHESGGAPPAASVPAPAAAQPTASQVGPDAVSRATGAREAFARVAMLTATVGPALFSRFQCVAARRTAWRKVFCGPSASAVRRLRGAARAHGDARARANWEASKCPGARAQSGRGSSRHARVHAVRKRPIQASAVQCLPAGITRTAPQAGTKPRCIVKRGGKDSGLMFLTDRWRVAHAARTRQPLSASEEAEFYRAASLFQPLSSTMATRFTSSSTSVLPAEPAPTGLQTAASMASFVVRG